MSYLPSLSLMGLAASRPGAAAAVPERPFSSLVSESDSLGAAATSYVFNNTWAASKGWTPGSDADAFTNLGVGGAVLGVPSDRTAGSGGSNAGNSLWARADQVVAQNPSHVTILIGANDFATVAPATDAPTYYARVKAYADYLRTNIAGVKIGICGNFMRANAVANATAQALWALYRASVGTDFDFYLPLGEHPVMTEAAYSNPTYSSDGLHPSAAGHDLYREVYAAVMDPIVAGATGSNPSAFTFTDLSNQAQNAAVSARTIVSGMGRAQSATASVTGLGTISRGQGTAGTGNLTVVNGDIITSALTTASAAATERTQSLTIGTRSDVWSVTTALSNPAVWTPNISPPAALDKAFASTSHTFTSVSFAAGLGIVMVSMMARNCTAVTVNGVAATKVAQSSSGQGSSIWQVNIPTGGSFNVVVTGADALSGLAISTGTITGAATSATGTATKAYGYTNDPQVTAAALAVPSGGIGLACLTSESNAPATWAVGTEETDHGNGTGTPIRHTSGSLTATGTPSINGFAFAGSSMAAAAWGSA